MYSFCPSDYLAIRNDPEILQLTFDSEEPTDYYQILERAVAKFFGMENVLFFPDSYMAFIALLRSVIQNDDLILVPPDASGSLLDVLEILPRHCENIHLGTLHVQTFKNIPSTTSRVVILADGINETTGKLSPVEDWNTHLQTLYTERGVPGLIVLEDSHGVGILGKNYRGTFEHFGLNANRALNPASGVQYYFSGSLSEAFGACGGFLAGEKKWLKPIRKNEPTCCVKNQIPISNIVSIIKSLELARETERHIRLKNNIRLIFEKLKEAGLSFVSDPFVPFVLIKTPNPKEIQSVMNARGCRVAVTHFTKHPMLCVAVTSAHCEVEMDFLIKTLLDVLKSA